MKDDGRILVYGASALVTLLLSGCLTAKTADITLLMDEDAIPARHALLRLQERPVFPLDDRGRSFAMIDDSYDKRRAASDKPVNIEESKPRE